MKKKIYLVSFLVLILTLIIFIINTIKVDKESVNQKVTNKTVSQKIVNKSVNQKADKKEVNQEVVKFLDEIDYDEFIKKYRELKGYEEKVSLVKKFFSQEKIRKEMEEKYHNFTPEDKARNKSLYILTGVKNEWVSDEKEYLLYGALASVLLDGLDIVKIDTLWINILLKYGELILDCTDASPEDKENKCDGDDKRVLDKEYDREEKLDGIIDTVSFDNFWAKWLTWATIDN